MTFADPYHLALIVLLAPILWLGGKRRNAVGHSQVGVHASLSNRSVLRHANILLLCLLWISGCVALARPILPQVAERQAIETRDFVIQIDISGSMDETIDGGYPTFFASVPAPGQAPAPTRIAAARVAAIQFVGERQGDRVALLMFNDQSYYSWPLSSDLALVTHRLERIDRYVSGGTNFDGPNGAVQGAIDHFLEMSEAQTRVLILVTDGEAFMDSQRTQELERQLTDSHIRVYVLGVGPGWTTNSPLTRDLHQLIESVGGSVIPIGNDAQMREAFATINQLERSMVRIERSVSYLEIYGFLAAVAVLLLTAYLAFSALILEDA